ncbi:DUF4920 domain-containing protein [Lacinutrix sp. MedPE-SW]|uniref:DUF4920 domain-containing protein n=1 Tax=Lacinutrix sp. MedPE-SW TaxID=1860087 RepID=UPI00091AA0B5|nr:DUF4920 domain-containing protein [Lacinutrix sp. MedPE-SW]OIQ19415.1 MAG: DUF4920 domain-containing protein [Lacinutrix sp. MedPE-SW]
MKKIILIFSLIVVFSACKNEEKTTKEETAKEETTKEIVDASYKTFGKEIVANDALNTASMAEHYEAMKVGDSIDAKMTAKVNEVCKSKGCWMKLDLANGEEVMVKFKDYGFFMPKDIEGKEVIINGKAYVKEVSVDEQRHYAEDGGESAEAIAAITEPKRTYSFEADGVLLKE